MMRLDSVAESQRRKDRGKAGDIDLSVVAAGSRRPANVRLLARPTLLRLVREKSLP